MNKTIGWFFAIIFMILISLNISLFSNLGLLESLRIVFGSLYVLFLPGYIISYIFFPKSKPFEDKKKDEETSDAIDFLERIALSFALSIAIVPLCVFYLNLAGVKINLLNSFLTILGIIIISITILIIMKFRKRKKHKL